MNERFVEELVVASAILNRCREIISNEQNISWDAIYLDKISFEKRRITCVVCYNSDDIDFVDLTFEQVIRWTRITITIYLWRL